METITVYVQGSAEEPYQVEFRKNGPNLSAYCTCPAGTVGQLCKHRLRILQGNLDGIVGDQSEDVKKVVSWLAGTDVAAAIHELIQAEELLEQTKKRVSTLKKNLARTLTN